MNYSIENIKSAFKKIDSYKIIYYYSTKEYYLEGLLKTTINLLKKDEDDEVVFLDSFNLNLEELYDNITTLSFMGGSRIVVINKLLIQSFTDEDLELFLKMLDEDNEAVVVITSLLKDDKEKDGTKLKKLQKVAENQGLNAFIEYVQKDTTKVIKSMAKIFDTEISDSCVKYLMEVCGNDLVKIKNEVHKISALSNFTKIEIEHIDALATKNIEADVFKIMDCIIQKNTSKLLGILSSLIYLQNDPIMINGAVASGFIDMYRMKCATLQSKKHTEVHKEMKYTGNAYRLQKAFENSRKFTKEQLEKNINILYNLDIDLKSSPLDRKILIEMAFCELVS